MRFPNWLKVVWWAAIVGALTFFMWKRLPELLAGNGKAADVAVFGIWAALILAPLFSEVTLLGVTLKSKIEELKGEVSTKLHEIRNEVRNAVEVRNTFSPQLQFPTPMADAQLPQLEERIKTAVTATLDSYGIKERPKQSELVVEDDVSFLFATRYHIERELRRIAVGRQLISGERRTMPTFQLVRSLSEAEVLPGNLGNAIREVYAVCSPAIHGEQVTGAQLSFVKDVGPQLVSALRALQ